MTATRVHAVDDAAQFAGIQALQTANLRRHLATDGGADWQIVAWQCRR